MERSRVMVNARQFFRASLGASLLLVVLNTIALAEMPDRITVPWRQGLNNRLVQLEGSVMCVNCSLEEAQKGQPTARDLYVLENAQGSVVMRIDWIKDTGGWEQITLSPYLWVRTADQNLLQQLSTEANLFKEVKITGFLYSDRAFDLTGVRVSS
jgi:hypothetical protein